MKKPLIIAYMTIIAVTTSLVGLLIYVQYSYGERFVYTFDSFSIVGRGRMEAGEVADIAQLTLQISNLQIELSTIRYRTENDSSDDYAILAVDSIKKTDRGIEVVYGTYNALQVVSLINTLIENPNHIGIHTKFISTTSDTTTHNHTALYSYVCIRNSICYHEHNSVEYSFRKEVSYTVQGVFDPTMTLPPQTIGVSSKNFRDIYITRSLSLQPLSNTSTDSNAQSLKQELEAKRTVYLSNVFQSLSQKRYQAIDGTWSSYENTSEKLFSEELLYIQLIESLRNNQFIAEYNTLRRSASLNSDLLSVFSVLLFGQYTAHSSKWNKPILSPVEAINQEGFSSLTQLDYRESIAQHIAQGEYHILITELMAIDTTSLDLSQLVEHILFTIIATSTNNENIDFLIVNRILPAIRNIEGGWLVYRQEEMVDLHITAKTVWILRTMRPVDRHERYDFFANQIENSLLNFTNNNAIYPKFIYVKNNTLSSIQGAIDIDQIYPWLFSDGYWSFYVFGNSTSSMMWIATPVPVVELTIDDIGISLTIPSFYQEQLSYLLVGAISKPANVLINQQLFTNRADYENFNDGYYWDPQNEILSIKYQNKNQINSIQIRL